jgi:adenine/guanine phosphoribosyltransferase-like PRPP-binding protein
LVEALGGDVIGFSFVVNLSYLNGATKLKLKSENLFAVATY